jgi:membrane protein/epoxyqueuosine reductase
MARSRRSRRVRALGFLSRLRRAGGMLVSREIAVLTNAIAFNFLLCLFPLVLVIVAVAQQSGRGRGVLTALELVLRELIPFGHDAIASSLRNLTKAARALELVSLVLIVWGSSGIFMPVEMALNRAWGGRLHRDFWKSRLLALLMTLAGGALVLVSVALTVAARSYGKAWPGVAGSAAKASALLLSTLFFFLIYRFVPDAAVGWRVAARAALWAGVTWELVKYAFIVKLGEMNLQAFYGPLAFAAALLLWAYVSSLVLVFGALMSPIAPAPPADDG